MEELTNERRNTMSMDIYNIARRLRQINNKTTDPEVKSKLLEYIKQLNDIGTEVGGGLAVMIGKVLRS